MLMLNRILISRFGFECRLDSYWGWCRTSSSWRWRCSSKNVIPYGLCICEWAYSISLGRCTRMGNGWLMPIWCRQAGKRRHHRRFACGNRTISRGGNSTSYKVNNLYETNPTTCTTNLMYMYLPNPMSSFE